VSASGALFAGVDVGAAETKAAICDRDGRVLGRGRTRTRLPFDAPARAAFEEALRAAGARERDVAYVAATGLGRQSLSFHDVAITEITCAARGGSALAPHVRFVLDIGAQSTRAIRLRDGGRVAEFHMNEKCAAGSGSFVERVARYLEVPIEEVGRRSLESRAPRPISSICAVLAETEIINHVSEGVSVEDILRGVHESLADRALAQLKRVRLDGPVFLAGGLFRQEGIVAACRARFGVPVVVEPESPFACAVGAAVLARRRWEKRRAAAS
jgi:predicted CoA-substrate-specific enzyme activase